MTEKHSPGNIPADMAEEKQRLAYTVSLAEAFLARAIQSNEHHREDIREAQREMHENGAHGFTSLSSADDFEALAGLAQYINPIMHLGALYQATENKIALLERIISSPYFARIDFRFDLDGTMEKVYIGRSTLMDESAYEMVVYDWRSPIASVFYRFAAGSAYYDAPVGRVTGEILRKRQYEIHGGELEYFFDADVEIIDAILRKLLSQNASSTMKAIVETIQKEQDVVIRDMDSDLMMVQGAAGSGKTSIALHRAAYLLYQGLSSRLDAGNILILSPNTFFEQYIAQVLPELGEENTASAVIEGLFSKVLKRKHIQSKNQFFEKMTTNAMDKSLMKSSLEWKTSLPFVTILDRYAEDIRRKKMDTTNTKALYSALTGDEAYFSRMAEGITLPVNIREILQYSLKRTNARMLPYDDAAVLTYLKLKLQGANLYPNIKHVVIDEAQDYYPLHYCIFRLLFPGAKYTVLGDMNQTLEKAADLSLYTQISELLRKEKVSLVTMRKSFRCTNEILRFSSWFLPTGIEIQSFNREGEAPAVHGAADRSSLLASIAAQAQSCLDAGYGSVGLLCKTEKSALSLHRGLKDRIPLRFITDAGSAELQGLMILPIYMAKGLEFDAVLICDATDENYHSEDDKKLLYIACTRALHKLALLYMGEKSRLLPPDESSAG
ncbi:MAG: UvrD-helicase domain-containing protein [Clostridiales bacterium]|nr:UvrD-helicase domain-containing protein [Clostridiales bacterium]